MRTDSHLGVLLPVMLVLAPVATAALMMVAGREWSETVLCTFCTAAAVPVALPWLLQRPFDLFHPLGFVSLSVILGTTLRSFYLVFADSDRSAWLADYRPLDEILPGAYLLFASMCCIGLGYLAWGNRRARVERLPLLQRDLSMSRMRPVFIVVAVLATVAMADFLRRTGFQLNEISDLSTKRRVMVDENTRDFASLGYHRWAAHALVVPFFYMFMIMWIVRGNRSARPYALMSGGLALAFPFLVSDRSGLGFLIVSVFMTVSYVKRIPYGKLALVGIGLVILAGQMREWRMESRRDESSERPIEALLGNRNFTGITKTARIYTDTPAHMEREYGQTFMLWAIAWIPRTVWTSKPEISLGDRVTREIYYEEIGGGYPPGLVGELVINFGLIGALLGCLIYGSALRLFYNSFRPMLVTNPAVLLIYLSVIVELSFVLMGLQVARVVMLLMRTMVTLAVFLLIVGVPRAKAARDPRLGVAAT